MQQQQPHLAGKLVGQLDVLLLKAAKNSTASLTGSKVKRTFQRLVDDGALDRNSLKALEKAGDTAAKTFKALASFNGSQLAAAIDGNGRLDGTSTAAGKAAAIKAQQDLSDLLAQLSKGLDTLLRHRRQRCLPGRRGRHLHPLQRTRCAFPQHVGKRLAGQVD